MSATAAVQNLQPVYLRAASNFELGRMRLFRRVILPATLPQILTGIRIALGIAWLVVVAAEMIAVNSGLGYLIIDARNAGKRYDLVVAGMVVIGLIGLALDLVVRRLERFDEVSWVLWKPMKDLPYPWGREPATTCRTAQCSIGTSAHHTTTMGSPTADPRETGPLAITVRDLWMSYPSQRQGELTHVLERVNLEVREGEFVCIVGPSGCGSTTLLNIIGGFSARAGARSSSRENPWMAPTDGGSSSFRRGASFPGSRFARTSGSASTGLVGSRRRDPALCGDDGAVRVRAGSTLASYRAGCDSGSRSP